MKGIGTDIVQIDRVHQVYTKQGERFVKRILTEYEQRRFLERGQPIRYLASRFAAKEAVSKALGTGIAQGIRFTDIDVSSNELGAPIVSLYGKALARFQALNATSIMVTLSDEKEYAVAFAVLV